MAAAGLFSAAAAVGVAGVGGVYRAWWDQPNDGTTRHLSPDELAFCDALADAIFPPSDKLPLRGREALVGRQVDLVLDGMFPVQRNLLRLALHALDQWPRASTGLPFRELPVEQGVRVLSEWTQSDIAELRGLVASIYIFVAMAWSVHPAVAPTFDAQFRCGYGE